jgi:hypothetical protein
MEYLQYVSHIEQENKGGTARMMKYGVPLYEKEGVAGQFGSSFDLFPLVQRLRVAVERAGEHARSSQKYYKACARDANAPY